MVRQFVGIVLFSVGLGGLFGGFEHEAFGGSPAKKVGAGADAKTRTFQFNYGGRITGLSPKSTVRVWLPVPPSNADQQVERTSMALPARPSFGRDKKYGNEIMYFETAVSDLGEIGFDIAYRVTRKEVRALNGAEHVPLSEAQRKIYLLANAMVPIDGKPQALLKKLELRKGDELKMGQTLYEVVDSHMRYDKSRPGYGNGDAEWACDSRFGNCTDFHSLFISMARSMHLPARFEIGFPLPSDADHGNIGGYHCWAQFYVDEHGWVPVDISEADKHPEMKKYYFGNLTADRVTFSTGRDLKLVPPQAGKPLNYFVYPYVEVDGKVWPKDRMEKRFQFEDIES